MLVVIWGVYEQPYEEIMRELECDGHNKIMGKIALKNELQTVPGMRHLPQTTR